MSFDEKSPFNVSYTERSPLDEDVALLFDYVLDSMGLVIAPGCRCPGELSFRSKLCSACEQMRTEYETPANSQSFSSRENAIKAAAALTAKLLRTENSRFYIRFIQYAKQRCPGFAQAVQVKFGQTEGLPPSFGSRFQKGYFWGDANA